MCVVQQEVAVVRVDFVVFRSRISAEWNGQFVFHVIHVVSLAIFVHLFSLVLHTCKETNLHHTEWNQHQENVFLVRCPYARGWWYLRLKKVSCLEKCPRFGSVLTEGFKPTLLYVKSVTLLTMHKHSPELCLP